MEINRFIAAAAALCITAGAASPALYRNPVSVLPFTASAVDVTEYTEVTEGALTYRVYSDYAEVVGCDPGIEGELIIPDKVNDTYITRITEGAFKDCTGLEKVEFPVRLKWIGESAFSGCTGLTAVISNYGLTEISDHAFEGCVKLSSFEAQACLETLGSYAFSGCTSLTEMNLNENSMKASIGDHVFYNCTSLESVTLSDYIRLIPEAAFENCSSLREIEIPYCVKAVEARAFKGCTSLETVEHNDVYGTLKVIGEEAFADCTALISFEIPGGVETICSKAFAGCTYLSDIDESYSLKSVKSDSFLNTPWLRSKKEEGPVVICGLLTECQESSRTVDLTEYWFLEIKRIAEGAYSGCEELEEIHIPGSVETIFANAFDGCVNLKDVYFDGYEIQWESLKSYSEAEGNEALFENAQVHFRTTRLDPYESFKLKKDGLSYEVYGNHAEAGGLYGETKGDIEIPSEINGVPVTKIRNYGFFNNENITSVIIPDSVIEIGEEAFTECSGLTEITIPGSVLYIGVRAFRNCENLENVTFSGKMPDIGGCAFEGTPWYEAQNDDSPFVIVNDILIEAKNVEGDIVVPDGVKGIGENAFYNSKITSVKIPEGVTKIGDLAFLYCFDLTSVEMPDGLTSIGSSAFSGCMNLKEIDIPESVTEIGAEAFSGTGITKLTIPGGVKNLGVLFQNNEKLTDVTILSGPETVDAMTFQGCKGLYSVKLPDTVKSIKSFAFDDCRNLTEFEIPAGVTEIGQGAFQFCRSLTSVTIPEGVTDIEKSTFSKCYELREIYIPAGMEMIWKDAFRYCENLTIYYGGTEEQWAELVKNSYAEGNEALFKKAEIHYNSAPKTASSLSGDANEDGKITVSDAVAVLQYIANAEKYALSEQGKKNADCDGEKGITGSDAIMIQKMDAGVADR